MEILQRYGKEELATLYIGNIENQIVEFVESTQPPYTRAEKWVLIISTLYGCPMRCRMCDAGDYYKGKVSKEGMLIQLKSMIYPRFPAGIIPIPKFKIQFARMGEPTLNEAVLDVLRELPDHFNAPGMIPCISTIAPQGCEGFLEELKKIKNQFYSNGKFQLQFSIHSTEQSERQKWMNKSIWNLERIAEYGETWFNKGDRKITLNFAVSQDSLVDPQKILKIFDPRKYYIKLTPLNPTHNVVQKSLISAITPENAESFPLAKKFQDLGFETLISIGAWEENQIGSNCGQFATQYINGEVLLKPDYESSKYKLN